MASDEEIIEEMATAIECCDKPYSSESLARAAFRIAETRIRERCAAEPKAGDTSDGSHTFNELYEYRMLYNAALFNEWARADQYDVHKSTRHSDGQECFGGGWFVVSARLPAGQITNHYGMAHWDIFQIPARHTAAEWDGHSPREAANRIAQLLRQSKGHTP